MWGGVWVGQVEQAGKGEGRVGECKGNGECSNKWVVGMWQMGRKGKGQGWGSVGKVWEEASWQLKITRSHELSAVWGKGNGRRSLSVFAQQPEPSQPRDRRCLKPRA